MPSALLERGCSRAARRRRQVGSGPLLTSWPVQEAQAQPSACFPAQTHPRASPWPCWPCPTPPGRDVRGGAQGDFRQDQGISRWPTEQSRALCRRRGLFKGRDAHETHGVLTGGARSRERRSRGAVASRPPARTGRWAALCRAQALGPGGSSRDLGSEQCSRLSAGRRYSSAACRMSPSLGRGRPCFSGRTPSDSCPSQRARDQKGSGHLTGCTWLGQRGTTRCVGPQGKGHS